jgi:hypothetical protein
LWQNLLFVVVWKRLLEIGMVIVFGTHITFSDFKEPDDEMSFIKAETRLLPAGETKRKIMTTKNLSPFDTTHEEVFELALQEKRISMPINSNKSFV